MRRYHSGAARLGPPVFSLVLAFGAHALAQTNEGGFPPARSEPASIGTSLSSGLFNDAVMLKWAGTVQAPPAAANVNPWSNRPVCASMFLKTDFQLNGKQGACNWLHNGVFSTNAMLGAAWSGAWSLWTAKSSESGDGFVTRFGRKFGQNAFKATGSYLGGVIAREDPRKRPPFLALRTEQRPRGFFKRFGHAIGGNFVSYRCVKDCTDASHIKKRPALSRVFGSLASGFSSELLTTDRAYSAKRAWNGVASAYGSTFVNAMFVEFKPELSAIGGKVFSHLFGGR
jgi:hypothetical protein